MRRSTPFLSLAWLIVTFALPDLALAADSAAGTVRFLFEPPPGASAAELCRLVEARAVRLVPQPSGELREIEPQNAVAVRAEPGPASSPWDRTCRFTLRGLSGLGAVRLRVRIVASPWWGRSWEYQETCPSRGGLPAPGSAGLHLCEPIRN